MDKKKTLELIGTIFITVIFIASYAAFGSNGSNTTSTTTITPQKTYFVSGTANGTVNGYGAGITIQIMNQSAASAVANVLAEMQSNSSISTYVSTANGSYEAFAQNINAYQLQQALYKRTNANSVSVQALTTFTLPVSITMYYNTQAIPVTMPQKNYTVTLSPLVGTGSQIRLRLQALVTANGTIYDNQLNIYTT